MIAKIMLHRGQGDICVMSETNFRSHFMKAALPALAYLNFILDFFFTVALKLFSLVKEIKKELRFYSSKEVRELVSLRHG